MLEDKTGIIALYRRHARAWAEDRGNRLHERAWLDRFLRLTAECATVLDLGCGSGEPIARYLIEQGCRLTGIDASPGMIAMCQESFPSEEHPQAAWQVADMRALHLDRRFAGILAWDSFFHLSPDDQRGMFPVFREHAAPGAALMFTSGTSLGEAIGSFRGEPMYHASLEPVEYRALLAAHGFDVAMHVTKDPDCDRTVWLARSR